MGRDEQHPFDEEAGDWEFPSGKELGALLRNKREKMGLTYAQISERTKLRPEFIEALENEDWDRLPSPAYVKGFIRSYARVLGLAEDGLVGLYQEIVPQHKAAPRSLQPPVPKRRMGILYLFLVLAFLAGGVTFYNWIEDRVHREGAIRYDSTVPANDTLPDTEKRRDVREEISEDRPNEQELTAGLIESQSAIPHKEHPPTDEGDVLQSNGQPAEDLTAQREETPNVETGSSSETETTASTAALPTETDGSDLILTAIVKERTWVRVSIDDKKPKEYIFGPESRPQWRALKSFELLIGNAGGIDLEFNGRKMENLGKPGQVIRLRLP